jgi:hypothetical protein
MRILLGDEAIPSLGMMAVSLIALEVCLSVFSLFDLWGHGIVFPS